MVFLTEFMDCHIGVDFNCTLSILMYVYEYLNKELNSNQYMTIDPRMSHVHKIKDFTNLHYFSTSKASWGQFVLNIVSRFQSISSIPVHLCG